jgi:hypothetical protein
MVGKHNSRPPEPEMANKIGRNDPCTCGSGKKSKHCCGGAPESTKAAEPAGHDRAIERAIDWLMNRHRKAALAAMDDLLFRGLSDEAADNLRHLDQETLQGIEINTMEWLLAEGDILAHGTRKRVADCLLGPGGPLFTVGERSFFAQLAKRPLHLYIVTDIVSGRQITLCDALDGREQPITVQEKSGSQTLKVGTYLGCRVLAFDNHFELSGAVYPFSQFMGPEAVNYIKHGLKDFKNHPERINAFVGLALRRKWLEQYVVPMTMPTMMDAYSGEPILLITDHYRVEDWEKLAKILDLQTDVEGDQKSGWTRFIDCEDGERRSLAAINIEPTPNRISIFYKTRAYADKGRAWFDALTDGTVKFLMQEISDLTGAMAGRSPARREPQEIGQEGLPPELITEAIAKALHRAYAHWADEPIPALSGKTPRQAMKTPAGSERVKGLIRSYEAAEKEQAAQQNRAPASFDFLWQAIGVSPQ